MTSSELESIYKETAPEKISTFVGTVEKLTTSEALTSTLLMTALGRIAENEVPSARTLGRKGADMTAQDRLQLTKAAVVTACSLIYACKTCSKNEARDKTLLLLEYISYLNNGKDYDLLRIAADACSYRMKFPGFKISQIENSIGIDMIAHNLASKAIFDRQSPLQPLKINGAGSMSAAGGTISISSASIWEQAVVSFSGHGDALEACTKNERDEKLKSSETEKIAPLEKFMRSFLLAQDQSPKSASGTKPKSLIQDERYTIGDIRIDEDGQTILCRAIGTDYDGDCEIEYEELVKGLYTDDLIDYFPPEGCIENAVLVEEGDMPLFSIRDAYLGYAKKTALKDRNSRRTYKARVIDFYKAKSEDKDRVILLSDKGYGGLMFDKGSLKEGDIVTVCTQSIQDTPHGLYINMADAAPGYGTAPESFEDESVLSGFFTQGTGKQSGGNTVDASHDNPKEKEIAGQIGTILLHSTERDSMARYRDLICSAFIFKMTGDTGMLKNAIAEAEYLGQCLRFAEGLEIRDRSGVDALTGSQRRILKILHSIGKRMGISESAALVLGMKDEKEQKIAELFLAHSLSKSNPDEMKYTQEAIRKKICSALGVRDHFQGKVAKGGGKYGKGELDNVEFKSSYVFSNSDGTPDLYRQGRGQVLEAVCGFLNKDGGTVYVGVSDSGDPLTAKDYGLNADIRWFSSNFATEGGRRERLLHHPVPQPVNLDSYSRFIKDDAELYFKPGVRDCITVTPTEDADAIRITVRPSEFKIAKLYTDNTWTDGQVYIRDGVETRPMKRWEQEQRLMNLRRPGKIEQLILTLSDAIDKKSKVILKDYASSNSNNVQDRLVVPINLVCNDENLWAYDIDRKEFREFRLSRIGSIDTNIEDPIYDHSFLPGKADVFRWVKPDESYHIKLKLKLHALNILKEEYSDAADLPSEELYPLDENGETWMLDTTLHGLEAARRFVIGLADQVEIMDTEDSDKLKEKIREFAREYIDSGSTNAEPKS